ncbi:hypothetical protein C476_15480 [Natrinema limicola JCM 13563]|uniref:Uncharacterized protein n=1 Tax=Natrinema limicola JCM 13563 TaxID=1230457 RepID=M0C5B5_9EURY|nr:hypothetical protein C476_15480 [Natrinema limicola JCM 13563]
MLISSRSARSLIVGHLADNVDDLLGSRTDPLEFLEFRNSCADPPIPLLLLLAIELSGGPVASGVTRRVHVAAHA